MKTVSILIIAILCLCLPSYVAAQVPGIINYQGRVSVGGTNFNGTGQFKFALLNGTGPGGVGLWSNGVNAVSITVTKGLYSVLLGDTSIANMTYAMPATVFTNSDVRLRVWFNDGVSGLQQLSPDQRLGSVGYAMSAAYLRVFGTANTFVGDNAGNLTMSGWNNTAIGGEALEANTSGSQNTANGAGALGSNTIGVENTAVGNAALAHNTSGSYNTANGDFALYYNTNGSYNTAIGVSALDANTSGSYNTANGYVALHDNTSGSYNTASGYQALYANTRGFENTAVGYAALGNNASGSQNTANGAGALLSNTSGSSNTASGYQALDYNTSGSYNTANGVRALSFNTSGSSNIALGFQAGGDLTTGNNNIDIGNGGVAGDANTIRIGTTNVQAKTYIAGISGVTISPAGGAVYINSYGQLGTVNSSRRFKEAIHDMGDQSDVLLSLRPVAFRYKPEYDPLGTLQFGLVAEEVEKAAPELVLRDAKGTVSSVRYEQVNAMLLNEFLKEHRRVQEQERQIAELRQRNATLDNRLERIEKRLDQGGK